MLKKVLKGIAGGVAWGCVFATVVNIIGYGIQGNAWFEGMKFGFTAQVLAAMLVGIGWVLPTIVYQYERFSLAVQTLIHMTVGFVVYIPCMLYMGWVPVEQGTGMILFVVLAMAILAVVIWFCFYLYYKNEARKMNRKLQNMPR